MIKDKNKLEIYKRQSCAQIPLKKEFFLLDGSEKKSKDELYELIAYESKNKEEITIFCPGKGTLEDPLIITLPKDFPCNNIEFRFVPEFVVFKNSDFNSGECIIIMCDNFTIINCQFFKLSLNLCKDGLNLDNVKVNNLMNIDDTFNCFLKDCDINGLVLKHSFRNRLLNCTIGTVKKNVNNRENVFEGLKTSEEEAQKILKTQYYPNYLKITCWPIIAFIFFIFLYNAGVTIFIIPIGIVLVMLFVLILDFHTFKKSNSEYSGNKIRI
ncbi:MAG: hypothetical protein JW891_10535 [Candidatus Lokiarchaeota archaeon]|nr:hypothetical protein [Candidatus Lokiarchaeota archaeon]